MDLYILGVTVFVVLSGKGNTH